MINFFDTTLSHPELLVYLERLCKKKQHHGLVMLSLTKEKDIQKVKEYVKGRTAFPVLLDAEKQYGKTRFR